MLNMSRVISNVFHLIMIFIDNLFGGCCILLWRSTTFLGELLAFEIITAHSFRVIIRA